MHLTLLTHKNKPNKTGGRQQDRIRQGREREHEQHHHHRCRWGNSRAFVMIA
jgi:hypothetical protein